MAIEAEASSELCVEAHGASDRGRVRTGNEDVVVVEPELSLYAVCDGAGGHDAGATAASEAGKCMVHYMRQTQQAALARAVFGPAGIANDARRLAASIHRANAHVFEIAKRAGSARGMGTTAVAACFSLGPALVHVAHVGDSRCYRFRGGHLEQLTHDHSFLNDVLEHRPDIEDQILGQLPRHTVTRAVGLEKTVKVPVISREVADGDRYLLCSDGLSGPVEARVIAEVLAAGDSPAETVQALIDRANAAGGPDNVSVVVIDCSGPRESALPVEPPRGSDAASDLAARSSEPELLLVGIEELHLSELGAEGDELARLLENLLKGG